MSDVLVFERAAPSFAPNLSQRGHHIVYRTNESNHCPGCGRSQWIIGRISAECGFCGTAVPLAEAKFDEHGGSSSKPRLRAAAGTAEQRRFPRIPGKGRKLQLLIDGSPVNFALQNISEGGAMGEGAPKLEPGAAVYVRFEGGILVPAIVKWTEDGMVGLAFTAPIMLDRSTDQTN